MPGAPPLSTTPVANLSLVSTTPLANFATGTAGVVDTGGKFATGVSYTGDTKSVPLPVKCQLN